VACGGADPSPVGADGAASTSLASTLGTLHPLAFDLQTPFVGEAIATRAPRRVGDYGAFDVLATDMDLDGDTDVLINWHLGDLELFENNPPALNVVNAPNADRSGLTLQPGVASMGAPWEADLVERASSLGPGVHVWCEGRMSWSLYLVAPEDGEPIRLEVTCNEEIKAEGLLKGESLAEDREHLSLRMRANDPPRRLKLSHDYPSAGMKIEQRASLGPALPYWVGPESTAFPGPTLELRKSDPHGMAWVQMFGSAEPDLVVGRGGNRGTLAKPDSPKSNRVFTFSGDGTRYTQMDTAKLPMDFARSRGLEWVDVDNDGRLELSLSNKYSPNGLWVASGDLAEEGGHFENRARRRALSTWEGQASAWFDLDGDGWQDQVVIVRKQLILLRNPGTGRFTSEPAGPLGLKLPGAYKLRQEGFDKTTLNVFDVDADGELDLWVSSIGERRFHRVFLRRGELFEDATNRLGLVELMGTEAVVPVDVDNDGFVDVVALGRKPQVLRNRGGQRFDPVSLTDLLPTLPAGIEPKDQVNGATAADVDGDGRSDLILVAQERYVAFNRSEHGNHCLLVHLTQVGEEGAFEPIGTLVRVTRDDGFVRVARYGSERRSFVSQTLGPLRFGIAAGTRVTAVEVRWPGESEWKPADLPEGWVLRLQR